MLRAGDRMLNTARTLASLLGLTLILCGMAAPRADAATDVVLVFDTTGSMTDALSEAKDDILDVIATVDSRFPDVRYAVASVRDYGDIYGESGDLPWELEQPLTADRDLVQDAIAGLSASGGGDGPESYGRALFEADQDPALGFRPGAQRLTVLVADNVPHDDDLNVGIPLDDQVTESPYDTGVDPGRDEVIGTTDDIDWQPLLASLKARGMPLYFVLFKGSDELLPYWRAWAGSTGGSASSAADDALGSTLVDSISSGAVGCGRSYQRLVSVDVCADRIVDAGAGIMQATGDVRLDGGVTVGDGPIVLDPSAAEVRSTGPVPISVMRNGSPTPIGSAVLTVQARSADDPVSGRTGLAPMTLATFDASKLFVGGVGLVPGTAAFLDPRDGGGVILTVNPLFDLLSVGPQGTLAVGFHADQGTRILGGKAGFNGVRVMGGTVTAALSYEGASDAWKLEGDFELPKVFGAGLSGSLASGKIDSFGIKIKSPTGVPLGSTGFFLDTFSGEVSQLAKGPPKLKVGTTGGYGPKLPVIDKRTLNLEKAELSLDTALNGEIKGEIGLVDRRLAGGDIDVQIGINPSFRASGALNADIMLLGTGWSGGYRLDLDSHHYTGTGRVAFKVAGHTATNAAAIISDEGSGVTGKPCGICPTVGAGIRWRNVLKFPPQPEWIGADIERYRTISPRSTARAGGLAASAAAAPARVIVVASGTSLLALDGRGAGPRLRDPNGRIRTLDRPGPLADAARADDGRWTLTILRPHAGRWRLLSAGGTTRSQVVPPLGTVRPLALAPKTTSRRRLGRRSVVVRWRSVGLPAGARIAVTRTTVLGRPGTIVGSANARAGHLKLRYTAMKADRANRLGLVVSAGGIPFRRIGVPGIVWR